MIIYRIVNKINGKCYIGQTIQSLAQRWREHCCHTSPCKALHNAIAKYGKENFVIFEIARYDNLQDLNNAEIYFIDYYQSLNIQYGYNLTTGGDSYKRSAETCKKISEARKGIKLSEEHKRKINAKGRKASNAAKLNMSIAQSKRTKHPTSKKVICNETGKIFLTLKEASTIMNIPYSSIKRVIQGKALNVRGFTFKVII